MRPSRHRAPQNLSGESRTGWALDIAAAVSKSALTFMATLAGLALIPGFLGWTGSVVQSGSMEPNISAGDVVLTSELPDSSPIPMGRVITFTVEDKLIVHRIIGLDENDAGGETLVTAGDANPQTDPWSATRDDITGQARLLVPFVGLPSFWLNHGQMLPFAAWVALTVIAMFIVLSGHFGKSVRRPASRAAVAVAAATFLALTIPTVAAGNEAQAAFATRTQTAMALQTKSYSPITVGAMAGMGAIAYSSISDVGSNGANYRSGVTGSVATSPGRSVSGFAGGKITGSTQLDTTAARNAMAAATAARTAVNEREVTAVKAQALTGTVTPGVYTSSTGAFTVSGTLVLDAKNDPSARFVFRTTGALAASQTTSIRLVNGAKAENVWWIIGTTAAVGTASTGTDTAFIGNLLVNGNAVLRSSKITGRVVSFTGSITLDNSDIAPTN
jgi:signal peptidase I